MHYFDEGIARRDGKNLNIQCLMFDNNTKLPDNARKQRFHYHKYAELIYVINGCVDVYIGNESYVISEKSMIIIYPDEPHDCTWQSPNKYIVVKLLPDILSASPHSYNDFEYIFNFTTLSHNKTRIISDDKNIGKLIENAYNNFAENSYSHELMVRADIIKVCAHILNFWKQKNEICQTHNPQDSANSEIINRIASHAKKVNGTMRTHEAAKMCNMSDGHFSRIFKSVMGKTFTQYSKGVKIAEAEKLLKCTDNSITDIALHLGYATTSHFIEDFRKEKGVSPGKYRIM